MAARRARPDTTATYPERLFGGNPSKGPLEARVCVHINMLENHKHMQRHRHGHIRIDVYAHVQGH